MTEPGVLDSIAARYLPGILDAVRREYPNSPRHTMRDAADRPVPRQIHPVFYGCFDWHSAVEMHWAALVLCRRAPDTACAAFDVLDAHLTPDNLQAEARYLRDNPGYERPYGWGWALTLADAAGDWAEMGSAEAGSAGTGSADAARWSAALDPLAETIEQALLAWLPKPAYPDRTGMHSNSAFALARALPWARRRSPQLAQAIEAAARRWFGTDADYRADFEPSGSDFLSPALTEIVLMHEVLDDAEFAQWYQRFCGARVPDRLLAPAVVTDPEDGQGAHLHGLNLYRCHALRRLLAGAEGAERDRIRAALDAHAAAGQAALDAPGWMAEHWLAAYGVLAFG